MDKLIGKFTDETPLWVLILIVCVTLPFYILVFMTLWNLVVPGVTGWQVINYWQAAVLVMLANMVNL